MATNGKMFKAQAFIMGEDAKRQLGKVAADLKGSLLTADLAVDVLAYLCQLLTSLETLAGCAPGELWDANSLASVASAKDLENAGMRKPYKGVTITRGRRKPKAPEGGVS